MHPRPIVLQWRPRNGRPVPSAYVLRWWHVDKAARLSRVVRLLGLPRCAGRAVKLQMDVRGRSASAYENTRQIVGARNFNTWEEIKMTNTAYAVTADELRQFIERVERLDAEKRDIADQVKDVMAEAKARGYDAGIIRKIVAIRKRAADDVAEENAVMEVYLSALGM